jgi:hypothetical protein
MIWGSTSLIEMEMPRQLRVGFRASRVEMVCLSKQDSIFYNKYSLIPGVKMQLFSSDGQPINEEKHLAKQRNPGVIWTNSVRF